MEINTRMQAAAKKLKIYWTGKACRRGHTSGRYVSTGSCVTCQNMANSAAQSKYGARLQIARAIGTVAVTVQVPPGREADVTAFAAALVMQRDADRTAELDRLIAQGPAIKALTQHVPPPRLTAEERAHTGIDTTGLPLHTKGLL